LFPAGSHRMGTTLALLAVIGIFYAAHRACAQRDLRRLVAYGSLGQLGFVVLGLFSVTYHGLSGALLQTLSHGATTSALLMLAGATRGRAPLAECGAPSSHRPRAAVIVVLILLGAIGVPGTSGFVGEFMIVSGSFVSVLLGANGPALAAAAAFAAVLSAAYGLRLLGGLLADGVRGGPDAAPSPRELAVLLPLCAVIYALGCYPAPVLQRMEPAVRSMAGEYRAKLRASDLNPELRELRDREAQGRIDAASAAGALAGGPPSLGVGR